MKGKQSSLVVLTLLFVGLFPIDAVEEWPIDENIPDPPIASSRKDRFPSPEERLKLYMSNWYVPPCADSAEGHVHYDFYDDGTEWPRLRVQSTDTNRTILDLSSQIAPDTAFFIDPGTVFDCLLPDPQPKYENRVEFRKNMNMYCVDAASSILTAIQHVNSESNQTIPTIVQFGDLKHSHFYGSVTIPHLKKFRSAAQSPQSLQKVVQSTCYDANRPNLEIIHDSDYMQPIVWKLASRRHFGNLERVSREDTAWEHKKDMAIWRGQLTGSRDGGFDKDLPAETNCLKLKRCRLVYKHSNSTLIHARLTSTRNRLPDVLNGVPLLAPATTIRRLLEYKGIIMLEGNDVASGLKWALLSQSVVLMPTPKHTSWAMEELLEPWIHYVPLNENATDVEEKMQWVVDNDDMARRIAERGSLWMEDLVFHPDAAEDDRWIQEEIIRRYRKHFVQGIDNGRQNVATL